MIVSHRLSFGHTLLINTSFGLTMTFRWITQAVMTHPNHIKAVA